MGLFTRSTKAMPQSVRLISQMRVKIKGLFKEKANRSAQWRIFGRESQRCRQKTGFFSEIGFPLEADNGGFTG